MAKIAKEVGIGDGKVTVIVNESRANRDYYDIYLLRPVAVMRRKETEDLGYHAFSIRSRKIMDENSLSEDHLNTQ